MYRCGGAGSCACTRCSARPRERLRACVDAGPRRPVVGRQAMQKSALARAPAAAALPAPTRVVQRSRSGSARACASRASGDRRGAAGGDTACGRQESCARKPCSCALLATIASRRGPGRLRAVCDSLPLIGVPLAVREPGCPAARHRAPASSSRQRHSGTACVSHGGRERRQSQGADRPHRSHH